MAWPSSPPSSQANRIRATPGADRYGEQFDCWCARDVPGTNGRQPVPTRSVTWPSAVETLFTRNCPTRPPKPPGWNTTSAKHVPCAASVPPHEPPTMRKSVLRVVRSTGALAPPSLRIWMRCATLCVPIMRSPKPMKPGETRISGTGCGTECAVIGMLRDPPDALLTTVSVPVKSPTVAGLNPTVSVQLAPGVRFDGHGLMSVNGPLTEMLENDRTALPLLRTVTASD